MTEQRPPTLPLDNDDAASQLDEIAELLEGQGANPFRIRAYHRAAETLRDLPRPVHAMLEDEGTESLQSLEGIGESLARTIAQLVQTGRLGLLDRLRGEWEPEDAFTSVPGIGPELARRIHEELGIESLAALEAAAADGRLGRVPGMGPGRVQAVRESLSYRFRKEREGEQRPARQVDRRPPDEPSVAELLDVDEEYAREARANRLPRIAPRRFNPTREAWLPILHTERGERHYTALYSNTARAHELNKTRDWLVIYRDDPGGEGQWTVVTGRFGELRGRRVVRGREAECREHYGRGSTGRSSTG